MQTKQEIREYQHNYYNKHRDRLREYQRLYSKQHRKTTYYHRQPPQLELTKKREFTQSNLLHLPAESFGKTVDKILKGEYNYTPLRKNRQ